MRPLPRVCTGRGPWADHVVALHMVRIQPLYALVELDALAELVGLCWTTALTTTGRSSDHSSRSSSSSLRCRDHPEYGRS
ncbi:hypothetical protein ACFXKF_33135 [Streptomyces scopuliridis]|uniref:hypothetical protein n=1 Tax=Streptomyces scopuliridis TaxID=452529 RepID=UPI003696C71B